MLIQKAFDTVFQETPPPFTNGVFMYAEFGGDHLAGQAARRSAE